VCESDVARKRIPPKCEEGEEQKNRSHEAVTNKQNRDARLIAEHPWFNITMNCVGAAVR